MCGEKMSMGKSPFRYAWITPACAGKRTPTSSRSPRKWDHPRVCGEKAGRRRLCRASGGSPPRARGKGGGLFPFPRGLGITPACAGKSHPKGVMKPPQLDHPRVRGEKAKSRTQVSARRGSPPRARGKARASAKKSASARITPACAGKSGTRPSARGKTRDHPRVRGEKTTFGMNVTP